MKYAIENFIDHAIELVTEYAILRWFMHVYVKTAHVCMQNMSILECLYTYTYTHCKYSYLTYKYIHIDMTDFEI